MDITAGHLTRDFARRTSNWIFQDTKTSRDPRLDFMRGFVFIILFASHFDYFSPFMFIAWERVGVVGSAETFISLAGIVIGIVFGNKMHKDGLAACMPGLINRAIDLYKINLIVILAVGLLRYVSWLDTSLITTFYDPYTGMRYPLYPPQEEGIMRLLRDALLLKCGPHQFQIMGLYAVLFLVAPAVLFMLEKKRAVLLSAISCILYLVNYGTPESVPGTAEIRITGAQFEFGFPVLAWQVLFVHSVIAGYYKKEILAFFSDARNWWILSLAAGMSVAFMFFALNHPVDSFPGWAQLSVIPPETFTKLYHAYFAKYNLGPGRLVNHIVLFVTVFTILTRFWQPLNTALGWFFIPLGEASLYVFAIHIPLLLLVANTPLPAMNNIWINTLIHISVLSMTWLAVKKKFLFSWIPH